MPRIEPDGESEGGYNWFCCQVCMANYQTFRKMYSFLSSGSDITLVLNAVTLYFPLGWHWLYCFIQCRDHKVAIGVQMCNHFWQLLLDWSIMLYSKASESV